MTTMVKSGTFLVIFQVLTLVHGFPWLADRSTLDFSASAAAANPVPATTSPSQAQSFPAYTWSASLLVDVTGAHAYQDPQPGQTRGPCPAQNALANHGYLDRSGYTTWGACVAANGLVFNLAPDFAGFLCLTGQITGGDVLSATPFSLGNSSTFDDTVKQVCVVQTGLLGVIQSIVCKLSSFLNKALGTSSFGMAQTHNSFEGDSSFLSYDWGTYGLDASSVDLTAANLLWSQYRDANGGFDDLTKIIQWATYRKQYGIATNPCYFRAPQATLLAALGAYSLVPRCFSNSTPAGATLNSDVAASFFGLNVDAQGVVTSKGFGKEQIPRNWYRRPTPYTIPQFLTLDYSRFLLADPSLANVGGNTNGVNTFTGLDMGNLTGGVINGQNLMDDDNFVCLCK